MLTRNVIDDAQPPCGRMAAEYGVVADGQRGDPRLCPVRPVVSRDEIHPWVTATHAPDDSRRPISRCAEEPPRLPSTEPRRA